jgi:hypothetical protein
VVLTESPGEQVVAGALFFCGNLSLPQDARDKRAVIGTASGLVLLANPVCVAAPAREARDDQNPQTDALAGAVRKALLGRSRGKDRDGTMRRQRANSERMTRTILEPERIRLRYSRPGMLGP